MRASYSIPNDHEQERLLDTDLQFTALERAFSR